MATIHRVLLVDDEPVLLGPLRRLIQRAHPDALVVYASDPRTAEWQIQSTPIRLVVTDMRMHSDEHAGLRIIAAARAAGVAVAVLSGASEEELSELGLTVPVVFKSGSICKALTEIVERAFAA